MRRLRYPFQLVKQYFIFSESESESVCSLRPRSRYVREQLEDGVDTLEHIVGSQNQKLMVMAFETVRWLWVMKNCVEGRLGRVQVLLHAAKRALVKQGFERIQEFAVLNRSKVLTPTYLDSDRRKTLSTGGNTVRSEQLLEKQFIYIVKTNSTQRLILGDNGQNTNNMITPIKRGKSATLKVPLLAENVVIKEISVVEEERKRRRKGDRKKVDEKSAHCKEKSCASCKYCSMFDNMRLWEEPGRVKISTHNRKANHIFNETLEFKTHRKRVFLN